MDNEKLKFTEYEESTIYEAELRGALNSLELSTDQKKEQFRIFSLVQHTRHLLKGEIIKKIYPAEVLSKLNDDTSLDETSTNEFISYRLQDGFLPWPINYLHIIPDWVIITILGVIGLFLMKVFSTLRSHAAH